MRHIKLIAKVFVRFTARLLPTAAVALGCMMVQAIS
jgi:hypothetical protein